MGVIYKITNIVNGKFYIGQSADWRSRWRQHKTAARRGNTQHLYMAMRKYGIENFSVEIVDNALLREELNDKEIAVDCKA